MWRRRRTKPFEHLGHGWSARLLDTGHTHCRARGCWQSVRGRRKRRWAWRRRWWRGRRIRVCQRWRRRRFRRRWARLHEVRRRGAICACLAVATRAVIVRVLVLAPVLALHELHRFNRCRWWRDINGDVGGSERVVGVERSAAAHRERGRRRGRSGQDASAWAMGQRAVVAARVQAESALQAIASCESTVLRSVLRRAPRRATRHPPRVVRAGSWGLVCKRCSEWQALLRRSRLRLHNFERRRRKRRRRRQTEAALLALTPAAVVHGVLLLAPLCASGPVLA